MKEEKKRLKVLLRSAKEKDTTSSIQHCTRCSPRVSLAINIHKYKAYRLENKK